MKNPEKTDLSDYRMTASRLRALLGKGPMIEGSLCRVACRGVPRWQLTWKEGGKSATLYIPDREAERVREAVERWKEAKALFKALGEMSRRRIRESVKKPKPTPTAASGGSPRTRRTPDAPNGN